MPRPNLSSLISKFVFRETLTTEDKTVIRGDLSAEVAGAAALVQSLAATDATTKANAATAAAEAALAIETAARIAADATKQPLAASLTAYAADPTAAILANMPDALTYAGVDPNVSNSITVTANFGDGVETVVLLDIGASWQSLDGDFALTNDGIDWSIDKPSSGGGFFYPYLTTSPIDDLVGAVISLASPATGTPVLAVSALAATHLGQLCKTSTAWWIWNGTAWIPWATSNGSPIAYNATLSSYRKLTVSGADGSEIITISAL